VVRGKMFGSDLHAEMPSFEWDMCGCGHLSVLLWVGRGIVPDIQQTKTTDIQQTKITDQTKTTD
jgi:hypothetical protein